MKFATTILALASLAFEVSAFPAEFKARFAEAAAHAEAAGLPSPEGCPYAKKALEKRDLEKNDLGKRVFGVAPGFDPATQYVSTTGNHAFVPPGLGDARGPCPGLNAMANHNYIPHNGVATIDQFIQGTNQVFGMGLDLAAFLAIYGAVLDGDLEQWSIGGISLALPSSLGGLLGVPTGLDGSHNKYESDVSPTRGDLYEEGNNYLLQMDQWNDFYSQPLGPYGYDLTTLTNFRAKRFQQSIEQNPYFFNGPFTGVAVQPAAYTFIYRFMANKSAEYPEGYLDASVLKDFFSITGNPGNFKYTPGWERIPDNWYKRAIGDEYTIPFFQTDLVAAALKYPQFLDVGGNIGTTNSFTGVDLSSLTGGVYNAKNIFQGNNAQCFAYQFAQQASPDILSTLYLDVTGALSKLNSAFNNVITELACPQLAAIDRSNLAQYPGYSKSYNGYNGEK